jgi:Glycosyltransferase family 87
MAGRHGLFVLAPILVSLVVLARAVASDALAVDFAHGPLLAVSRLLAGAGPYPALHSQEVLSGAPFDWPALTALLGAPFTLLPTTLADVLFIALNIAAVVLALRCCSVRDWRLYGLVLLWPAVIAGWQTGNLTLLLALAIALLWRHRDRPAIAGALVALVVTLKLFLWPLGLWLLATRRYAGLAYAIAIGSVLNLIGWGLVGFDQLRRYAQLLTEVTKLLGPHAYTLAALLHASGYAALLGIAAPVLIACVALGRRGQDQRAFTLAVAACLLVTPLVWLHYFALLIVPLALACPRLAPAWFVSVLLQFPISTPAPWQVAVTLVAAAGITDSALVRGGERTVHPPSRPEPVALPPTPDSGPALPRRLKVTA